MTLFEPTLKINKLLVKRNNHEAYSAQFHSGVNIISGQNSAGKTTIIDFIAYALGANQERWKEEALLCTDVFAEVECNAVTVTLWRPISDSNKNPMSIFWGSMETALSSPIHEWSQYGYVKSASKESFSQVLFRALKLPELRGEANSNITMHQLLRLLYVDQRSLHSAIFRNDTWDNALIRETVGNYLCGIYDNDLYNSELRSKVVESELNKSVADLRSIFSVLGRSGQETNFEWIGSQISALQEREAELVGNLSIQKNQRTSAESVKDPGMSSLRAKLSKAKAALSNSEDERTALELEVQDSNLFISELRRRIDALENSDAARNYLGSIKFNFCPCCLAGLEDASSDKDCYLCKSPLQNNSGTSQLARMRNELELQHGESSRLLQTRLDRLDSLSVAIPGLKNTLKSLERDYAQTTQNWNSELEILLESINREIGETRQRIAQFIQAQKLGNTILQLQERRTALSAELEALRTIIEKLSFTQEDRKQESRSAIAEELIALLKKDVARQENFIAADTVDWSFGENRVSVNGITEFSESSMVLLRHCFHLALLIASTKHSFFRIPRFMILDGIDDGGLELERNHNLQRIVVEKSRQLTTEHQIIFATSQIDPSLNRDDLVVGKVLSIQSKALSLG